eukprot:74344_1
MTTFHFVSAIISLITVHYIQLLIHHNQQHYQLIPSINVYDAIHSKTSNDVSHNTASPIESYTTSPIESYTTSTSPIESYTTSPIESYTTSPIESYTKYTFDTQNKNHLHLKPTFTMISLENKENNNDETI